MCYNKIKLRYGCLRWKITFDPHAAGTDRGNPRDAGDTDACQAVKFEPLEKSGGFFRKTGSPCRTARGSFIY